MDQKNIAKIQQGIQALGKHDAYEIETGKVDSIDEQNQCCDVLISDDLIRPQVRLKMAMGSDVGAYIVPKKGSYCIIAKIEGGTDYFLLQSSEIDKFWIKIGSMTFEMTKDGVVYNDGNNKGLLILDKVKANFDTCKQNWDILKASVAAGFGAIGIDGGSGATAFNGVIGSAQWTWQDMEDKKFKH
jgi:hypothetical protein